LRYHVVAALLTLAGCVSETGDVETSTPDDTRPQTQAACLEAGGRWAPGGLWPEPLCFLPNPDAGKGCSKASDCAGACLSESRTCSPESPRFGCYGYLDEAGDEVVICVD